MNELNNKIKYNISLNILGYQGRNSADFCNLLIFKKKRL